MRARVEADSAAVYILAGDGSVELLSFNREQELASVSKLAMPSFTGSCYTPSYLELAGSSLVLAGLRGSLVLCHADSDQASYQTAVQGTVVSMAMLERAAVRYIALALQDDDLSGHWLQLYRVTDTDIQAAAKAPLPPGTKP